jgi:hypothetical protein
VWLAVCFHVAIQLPASVEVFSYLAIAALAIWAVPSTRDRVLALPATTRARPAVAAALRRLDWLARFQLLPSSPDGQTAAAVSGDLGVVGAGGLSGGGVDVVTVVDRDGRVRTGRAAVVFVLSRLPLTAWFALPVRLLPSMRRAGEERA